ncbi:MAG: hypothetical protein JNK50_06085 [Bacteroidia bacterium]|nr:hypothetical protein [Bacteroidia bacterium]
MIDALNSKTHHPDIQKSFVPKTLEYLDTLKSHLNIILQSGDLDIDILANNNLYQFNELNEAFQTIELYRYEVIENYDGPEIYFSKKIARIYNEIRNLSIPPIITTISNSENYYWAHPVFEIIAVPYGEENNLLNLPDLFHEIGHLICKQYPNIVDSKFVPSLDKYFKDEIDRSYDEKTHEHYVPFYTEKLSKWKDYWIEEFTCDLIATFLCGPAFANANMKMSALSNGSSAIYADSPSHPSDEARMRAVFLMLDKLGFNNECAKIKADWELFLHHTNNPKHPDYKFIFPNDLLAELTEIVYDYCVGIDLASYNEQLKNHKEPISKHINDAWNLLHSKPKEFEDWQKKIIDQISKEIS